jgi:hypothetical protein
MYLLVHGKVHHAVASQPNPSAVALFSRHELSSEVRSMPVSTLVLAAINKDMFYESKKALNNCESTIIGRFCNDPVMIKRIHCGLIR